MPSLQLLHPRSLQVYPFYRQKPLYGTLSKRYFFPYGAFAIKADHLGSVSTLTNEAGFAIENTTYGPFGTDEDEHTNSLGDEESLAHLTNSQATQKHL